MLDNFKHMVKGHITIKDAKSGEIILDKDNQIHYENMSIALANSLTNNGSGFV